MWRVEGAACQSLVLTLCLTRDRERPRPPEGRQGAAVFYVKPDWPVRGPSKPLKAFARVYALAREV